MADPSGEQLHNMLANMNLANNFVIVERLDADPDPDHVYFVQVMLHGEPGYGCYQIEYRDGEASAHFQAIVQRETEWGSVHDNGFEQVVQVVQEWAGDRPSWRTALPWKRLDPSQEPDA